MVGLLLLLGGVTPHTVQAHQSPSSGWWEANGFLTPGEQDCWQNPGSGGAAGSAWREWLYHFQIAWVKPSPGLDVILQLYLFYTDFQGREQAQLLREVDSYGSGVSESLGHYLIPADFPNQEAIQTGSLAICVQSYSGQGSYIERDKLLDGPSQ